MRFGINLRGDLAKLDDGDIASRLETLMAEREALYRAVPFSSGNKWLYQRGVGIVFGRGLLHARIFDRFYALQYLGSSLFRALSAGLRVEGRARRDQAPHGA